MLDFSLEEHSKYLICKTKTQYSCHIHPVATDTIIYKVTYINDGLNSKFYVLRVFVKPMNQHSTFFTLFTSDKPASILKAIKTDLLQRILSTLHEYKV